jgi:transcriptional regulator with XRE-family HTH domain
MRREAGLTQEEFWGRVGITQSGGSRYEAGRAVPEPVRLLLTIAYGSKREREMVLRTLRPNGTETAPANRQSRTEGRATAPMPERAARP